ncbi:MAG: hypothetical protein EAY81_10855 [Bacteroidetes bacterium]|nr:MAG: hypothetical protein EAY81_10855 [Bacteroidota bacterium]
MKNAKLLSALLIAQTFTLLLYTAWAFTNEGANLFSTFFANIQAMGWSGQFNADFTCYLLLSGLWIMWRNQFTRSSVLLAMLASIIGILFFAPYLLYLITKENGNLKRVFIGNH